MIFTFVCRIPDDGDSAPKRARISDSNSSSPLISSGSSSADTRLVGSLSNGISDCSDAITSANNILNIDWPVTALISPTDTDFARRCDSGTWYSYKSIIFKFAHRPSDPVAEKKAPMGVLAFDLDGTLIRTKSGKKFARDEEYVTDWALWDPSIPAALKSWHDRGYLLAIISNQNGVETNRVIAAEMKNKVDAILQVRSAYTSRFCRSPVPDLSCNWDRDWGCPSTSSAPRHRWMCSASRARGCGSSFWPATATHMLRALPRETCLQ